MSANIPEIIKHLKVKRRDELKARKIAEQGYPESTSPLKGVEPAEHK